MDDSPSSLRYHRAIFELLGREPRVSEDAPRVIERREEACGVRFPDSVREWYTQDGAAELMRWYGGEDHTTPLDRLGSLEEVRLGFLHVMTENQGVANWCVRLDGSDDPPVDVYEDDWGAEPAKEEREPWSSAFSIFVFDRVANAFIDAWFRELRVGARDRWPDESDLAHLRGRVREGPRTAGGGERLTTYRFFDTDGLVTFQGDHDEAEGGEDGLRGEWSIQGRTEEGLFNLCQVVWPIGTLSQTLASQYHTSYDNRADDGLRRLGRTIEPRPRPPVGWANAVHRREAIRRVLGASGLAAAVLFVGWLPLWGGFRLIGRWTGLRLSAKALAVYFAAVWAALTGISLAALALDWLSWGATTRRARREAPNRRDDR